MATRSGETPHGHMLRQAQITQGQEGQEEEEEEEKEGEEEEARRILSSTLCTATFCLALYCGGKGTDVCQQGQMCQTESQHEPCRQKRKKARKNSPRQTPGPKEMARRAD